MDDSSMRVSCADRADAVIALREHLVAGRQRTVRSASLGMTLRGSSR
jgi:hypothetical protein